MIDIITYFVIGIGLSIDAFLACLSIGIDNTRSKRAIFKTPYIIGAFHIVFPIAAYWATHLIIELPESAKIAAFGSYVAGSIFFILGLLNIFKKSETKKTYVVSLIDILLLSFSVSIDSILIGMSFGFSGTYNIYLAGIIFGVIAGVTSYISIRLGRMSIKYFKHAHILSGIFFIILGILTFLGKI